MDLVQLSGFKRIYAVDTFAKQYKKLFGKSEAQYIKYSEKLNTNLGILDALGLDALEMQKFESLVNEDGLYSIRHVSQINPRVIFTVITTISDEGEIVLLSCAKEKSTADYDKAKQTAQQYRKELLKNANE